MLDVTQIAIDGCNMKPPKLYEGLSSRMCWDSVLYCGYLANRTNEHQDGKSIISNTARIVTNSGNIPAGAIIGFFDGGNIIHAMISLGSGRAAGNKNACIGIGGPVGWEELALPRVGGRGEFVPGGQRRTIVMRYSEVWP